MAGLPLWAFPSEEERRGATPGVGPSSPVGRVGSSWLLGAKESEGIPRFGVSGDCDVRSRCMTPVVSCVIVANIAMFQGDMCDRRGVRGCLKGVCLIYRFRAHHLFPVCPEKHEGN